MQRKKILKKIGKVLLYLCCFVLFLIIALIGFINTNYGKKFITNKIQVYLQNKIKTKVVIGSIDYRLPRSIKLKNIYLEDEKKDTLLNGELLSVDLKMIGLLWGEIDISKIELKNIRANILRNENDSNYNFQFLINAFTGKKNTALPVITDTTSVKIILKELGSIFCNDGYPIFYCTLSKRLIAIMIVFTFYEILHECSPYKSTPAYICELCNLFFIFCKIILHLTIT